MPKRHQLLKESAKKKADSEVKKTHYMVISMKGVEYSGKCEADYLKHSGVHIKI